MRVKIRPSRPRGSVSAPPSKSYAHRMMLCAALAEGESVLHGISESEDMAATIDCIRALGADCRRQGETLLVRGTGGHVHSGRFNCRACGSTLRFLIPSALLGGGESVFVGSARLMDRGVSVYEEVLPPGGITLSRGEGGLVCRGALTSGEYRLRGDVSSQFISGLLFALPLLPGDSVLVVDEPFESRSYVDITLSVMAAFGVDIRRVGQNRFEIPGGQCYVGRELTVEGDWSNGAALLAFGLIGGELSVSGLDPLSLQGDRVFERLATMLGQETVDLSDCPDLGPVLFALAAIRGGGRFCGTARLRIKESDRAAVMAAELAKCGIEVALSENEAVICGGTLVRPTKVISSHDDHRIVMAMVLVGSVVGCEIEGAEAVAKSFPDFFERLMSLGLEVEYDT